MNAPAVDQLISASDLRAAPQRNSDSSVPVSSSNKPEEERSMGITRLNHAVLFVRDLERSVAFYTEVLRFRRIDMTPEGFAGAAFLQAPGSNNDHDLGLFEIGSNAGPSGAGRTTVGLYHLAWEIDTLAEMQQLANSLAENGALAGSSDHGTTKSLYGKDPDGLEFEIAWIVPADRLDEAARQARKRIGRLDLDREIARYGADTRGGIGISVPIG
jgi:catechol-2,3-dioxygenase